MYLIKEQVTILNVSNLRFESDRLISILLVWVIQSPIERDRVILSPILLHFVITLFYFTLAFMYEIGEHRSYCL